MKTLKPVYIKWEDAFHPENCRWEGQEGVKEFLAESTYLCEGIGWLVSNTKRVVTIAMHKSGDEESVLHMQRIPKGCILKMNTLKIK